MAKTGLSFAFGYLFGNAAIIRYFLYPLDTITKHPRKQAFRINLAGARSSTSDCLRYEAWHRPASDSSITAINGKPRARLTYKR
jgi:hypothetical protein